MVFEKPCKQLKIRFLGRPNFYHLILMLFDVVYKCF